MGYQIKLLGMWLTVPEALFRSWDGERRVDGKAAEQAGTFDDGQARDEALWYAEVAR